MNIKLTFIGSSTCLECSYPWVVRNSLLQFEFKISTTSLDF